MITLSLSGPPYGIVDVAPAFTTPGSARMRSSAREISDRIAGSL